MPSNKIVPRRRRSPVGLGGTILILSEALRAAHGRTHGVLLAIVGWFLATAAERIAYHHLDILVGDQEGVVARLADLAAVDDANIAIAVVVDKVAQRTHHVLVVAAAHAAKEFHRNHPRFGCWSRRRCS